MSFEKISPRESREKEVNSRENDTMKSDRRTFLKNTAIATMALLVTNEFSKKKKVMGIIKDSINFRQMLPNKEKYCNNNSRKFWE